MIQADGKLTRVAVFYDGGYFSHVSNHYVYAHERRARIDFRGLHAYVRGRIAELERTDPRYVQIVDAHYFRGRKSARDANLVAERQFDEVLMRANITTHYTPLTRYGEKGIDVWLALEAFELVILKRYDVVVLVAGDGDYLPLLRKLETVGTRVVLLAWRLRSVGPDGLERETGVAPSLLDEATYPIMMSDVMADTTPDGAAVADALFLRRLPGADGTDDGEPSDTPSPSGEPSLELAAARPLAATPIVMTPIHDASRAGHAVSASYPPGEPPALASPSLEARTVSTMPAGDVSTGTIGVLRQGYGFIEEPGTQQGLYFYWADVEGIAFAMLHEGMRVRFVRGSNDRGPCARRVTLLESP